MPVLADPILSLLADPKRGERNLAALGSEICSVLEPYLGRFLGRVADPDMALNNLEHLIANPASRAFLPILLESDGRALEAALHLLATSQFFADTLAVYPEFLETLRSTPRLAQTSDLVSQLRTEVDAAADDLAVLRVFRRFRARHMLRIGINDILRDRQLEEVTRDLARVADVALEVALCHAIRTVSNRFGTPTAPGGAPSRVAAMAFGKLGGDELNYSSDIDLMFVYDHEGQTTGRRGGSPTANSTPE